MKHKILYIGLGVALISFFSINTASAAKKPKTKDAGSAESAKTAAAPSEKKEDATIVSAASKNVSGEVSAISKNYIAVVYNRDLKNKREEEVGIPITGKVAIEHKKNLSEIGVGDMVAVQYEESVRKDKEGGKNAKREAKVITFIRAKEKKSESTALDSETPQEQEGTTEE